MELVLNSSVFSRRLLRGLCSSRFFKRESTLHSRPGLVSFSSLWSKYLKKTTNFQEGKFIWAHYFRDLVDGQPAPLLWAPKVRRVERHGGGAWQRETALLKVAGKQREKREGATGNMHTPGAHGPPSPATTHLTTIITQLIHSN